jgi:hypothetical protein
MSNPVKLLLAATLVLGGFLGGFVTGRGTAPALGQQEVLRELERQLRPLEEHLARPPPEVRCAVAPTVDTTWLRAELARAVREELALHRPDASVPEQQPPPEPPPQSGPALQQAHRVIDEALRARRWTEEDARAFRRSLADLTDAQRDEVLRRFSATLNSNTLDVQTQGLPF